MKVWKVFVKEHRTLGNMIKYEDRADLSFSLEADVPSMAKRLARQLFNERWNGTFHIISSGILGKGAMNMIIREGPRIRPQLPPGTVQRTVPLARSPLQRKRG